LALYLAAKETPPERAEMLLTYAETLFQAS